ncbi:MAG: aminoacyl-tRNA hydrolase [Buchnera aphidicola (Chaetogeoica yunlongensis)]
MKRVKLIVGLANPIEKYDHTRHNIGAWFIQELAFKYNKKLKKNKKFLGYFSKIDLLSKEIYLLIPNTFMNLSGVSVSSILKYYNIKLNEILVVHDELDLMPGVLKFKLGCSHNGHNGLRNIISILGSNINFLRVRIGIGRPKNIYEKISNFVLSRPTKSELILIKQSIYNSINTFCYLIENDNNISMNSILDINLRLDFNRKL